MKPGHEEDPAGPVCWQFSQLHEVFPFYTENALYLVMLAWFSVKLQPNKTFASDSSNSQMECLQEEKLFRWQSMET